MHKLLNRRGFLALLAGTAALPYAGPSPAAAGARDKLRLGTPQAFDFDRLLRRAEHLAGKTYQPRPVPAPAVVDKIDYNAHSAIEFDPDYALFAGPSSRAPVTFFPLGKLFASEVRMYALERGMARRVMYSPEYFAIPEGNPARELPADAGFAGFRLHEAGTNRNDSQQEWAVFLGASYFRAVGALGQYGLSARGVAVNTGLGDAEEFPDFSEFYIAPARTADEPVLVYALLEGPSVVGAFRFALQRTTGVTMDVDQQLFIRAGQSIQRLGVAPLTSMFWHSEYQSSCGIDWRPEVHDSDGLAMWTGAGERLWRPLNNPGGVNTSAFVDHNPRGFGLAQRDRNFEHYLGKAYYDRRPSLWVQPLHNWGKGHVQLVEIPTEDEYHDNIVAFWVSDLAATPGAVFKYRYRLHWQDRPPPPPDDIARVVATRRGSGSAPGTPAPDDAQQFVVEFAGGGLTNLARDAAPTADISASRGEVSHVLVERIPTTRRWRLFFHLTASGSDPVELQAHLQAPGKPRLTETWMYQHLPGRINCARTRG